MGRGKPRPSFFMKVAATTHAGLLGSEHPQLPGYRLVERVHKRRLYKKWNPLLGIGSWIEFDDEAKTFKVGKTQDVEAILDHNKRVQNNFDGYRNKLMVQESNVPIVVDQQLKQMCGYNHHTGEYDEKKYRRFLNDPDYRYLRTAGKL